MKSYFVEYSQNVLFGGSDKRKGTQSEDAVVSSAVITSLTFTRSDCNQPLCAVNHRAIV